MTRRYPTRVEVVEGGCYRVPQGSGRRAGRPHRRAADMSRTWAVTVRRLSPCGRYATVARDGERTEYVVPVSVLRPET